MKGKNRWDRLESVESHQFFYLPKVRHCVPSGGPTVKYKNKTLKNKTDYMLAYENNKRTGTATVVIKGKGSYTGQKRIKFTIKKDESQETVKKMAAAYEGLIYKSVNQAVNALHRIFDK